MMVFSGTGSVANGLHVCGLSWSPVLLLDGKRPVLFEAGFTCLWRINEQMIRSALMGRQPETLFLTHVHWDHCGGAGYLKRSFPAMKIAASAKAASIMQRPNAITLMNELNAGVLPKALSQGRIDPSLASDEPFLPFDVETILKGGQTISLEAGLTIQVLATPGHTRDHLSYYIPEKKILVATEACGCQDRTGYVVAEFMVDYDLYLASLEHLAALPVEILCQGHHFVFVGEEEVKHFFDRSIREAHKFKARVDELLDREGGDIERVIMFIKAETYDNNPYIKQTEQAYMLNLRARVTHLAERYRKRGCVGESAN